MTPWERAKIWQEEHGTESFEELLGWHLSCGVIYSTPSIFMLAHEAHYDSDCKRISYDQPHNNAWFIQLAAVTRHTNPFHEMMKIASHPHKWIAFHRRNSFDPHAYLWSRFATHVGIEGTTAVSSVVERGAA